MTEVPVNKIICGHAPDVMDEWKPKSVHLAITSPPYWGLRDYGGGLEQIWGAHPKCEHVWDYTMRRRKKAHRAGFGAREEYAKGKDLDAADLTEVKSATCSTCGAWWGQLGLEPNPQMYVEHIVGIADSVYRVLRDDGSFWLNIGDTYYGSGKGAGGVNPKERYIMPGSSVPRQPTDGGWLQRKQLLMIPSRVAIAMQNRGWILRNSAIWYKPNAMPSSVKDRLNTTYENVYFFVKSPKYYFDLDSIRVPLAFSTNTRMKYPRALPGSKTMEGNYGVGGHDFSELEKSGKGKNPGDLMTISTESFPGKHFAVFPQKLVEPIIKSSSPKGGLVLDPFSGSGTVGKVARRLGRRFVLIDVSEEYCKMARENVKAGRYKTRDEKTEGLDKWFKK